LPWEKAAKLENVLTSLQALLRLASLRWLGVFVCALATLLATAGSASALDPAQTKTRVWGFDFAEHNSAGLFRAATAGKHQGNCSARAEAASGSLLAARGARTVAMTTTEAAQVLRTAPGNFANMPAFGKAVGWGRNGGEAAFARAGSITKAEAQALGISTDEAFAIRDAYRAVINSSKGAANPTALGREALMNRVGQLLQ
jgi:hypothetical protein